MADDRSSSLGGFVSFRSGDHSGSIVGIPDKKRSKNQNSQQEEKQEENQQQFAESEFVDKSAQLNATLNSLAIMNVASIIRKDSHSTIKKVNKNQSNPFDRR